MSWAFTDHGRYVAITCGGRWHLRSCLRLIEESGRWMATFQRDRILCDIAAVQGPAPELDRYVLGVRVAKILGPAKIAVVASREFVLTRFAMAVINQRGGNVFASIDFDEARRWLLAD